MNYKVFDCLNVCDCIYIFMKFTKLNKKNDVSLPKLVENDEHINGGFHLCADTYIE